jgi:8-oxo-dGTP pyrophosphatase MutT (NUDIX family)
MEPTPEDIRRKIRTRGVSDTLQGDHALNPDLLKSPPYCAASVLIPLLSHDDGYRVLFTQRTTHLHAHAGQVSFPGGRADKDDKDAVATALREAEEEIGLRCGNVEILGTLDDYLTRTGYKVTPVVGLVKEPQAWTPDDFEVAEIFEVPLAHILAPNVLARQKTMREGVERHDYAFTWQDFYIWGATAGMLKHFTDILSDD